MEQHPLQYFIDLIELKQVEQIRHSFLFVHPEHDVTYINEQGEYIDKWSLNKVGNAEEKVRITFSEFLNEFLPQKSTQALTSIDLYLLNNLEGKAKETFISLIINSINELLFKVKQYEDAIKYPTIEGTLNELRTTLQRKYPVNEVAPTPRSVTVDSHEAAKLKWNAGVASLCTMFYELANDYKLEKKGVSYLAATPDQLRKFILENFVDEEGNPFSETSVATYLDSRTDKKAKRNRVDIPSILSEVTKESKK